MVLNFRELFCHCRLLERLHGVFYEEHSMAKGKEVSPACKVAAGREESKATDTMFTKTLPRRLPPKKRWSALGNNAVLIQ
jgi:hypothetical protein